MRQWEHNKNANENPEFESIKLEPYICKIIDVVDVEEKEYLKICFDIVKDMNGDPALVGYFRKMMERNTNKNGWPNQGIINRSYKQSAEQFFDSFIVAVEKSNSNYHWDSNPKSLIGKFIVIVFREEEYEKTDGTIAISVKADQVRSLEALRNKEIKFPLSVKKIGGSKQSSSAKYNTPQESFSIDVNDDDLPF